MAHQDVAATIKCEMRYFMAGELAENVLHAKASGVIDLALLDSLEGVLATWAGDVWAPLASAQWTLQEIVLTDLNSLLGPRKSYPVVIPGTNLGNAMPANVTAAVKASIGRRGKGVNGRLFWVGLTEAQCTADVLEADIAASIVTGLNNLRDNVAALVGMEGLAVPHMVVAGIRPNPAQSDVIVEFALSDITLDSQRDRLPRHKKHRKPRFGGPTPR